MTTISGLLVHGQVVCILGVVRLAHHLELRIALEQRLQPHADKFVIVDQ